MQMTEGWTTVSPSPCVGDPDSAQAPPFLPRTETNIIAPAAGASIRAEEEWRFYDFNPNWHRDFELDDTQTASLKPGVPYSLQAWMSCDEPEVCAVPQDAAVGTTCSCLHHMQLLAPHAAA
jgi:hypothetical protein